METGVLVVSNREILSRNGHRGAVSLNGIKPLGSCADAQSAIKLVWDLEPSIVIVDATVRNLDALTLCRQILELKARTRVMILAGFSSSEQIIQALLSGVSGYLPADPEPDEITTAVRTVLANRIYISPRTTSYQGQNGLPNGGTSAAPPPSVLTDRERQVLTLLADGHSTRQIAAGLGISEKTVETHRGHISAKLSVRGVAELTKYAVRHRLTSVDV